jgi:hypothetical protein
MEFDWQTCVALLIVALAASLVIRRLFFGGSSSCGSGCHGCANNEETDAPRLVQLKQSQEHD